MTASEKNSIPPDTFLIGIGASPGIAIGEAYLVNRARMAAVERPIAPEEVAQEKEVFLEAVRLSRKQLEEVKSSVTDRQMAEHLYIIDTHLLILEDQMLIDETCAAIERGAGQCRRRPEAGSAEIPRGFRQHRGRIPAGAAFRYRFRRRSPAAQSHGGEPAVTGGNRPESRSSSPTIFLLPTPCRWTRRKSSAFLPMSAAGPPIPPFSAAPWASRRSLVWRRSLPCFRPGRR